MNIMNNDEQIEQLISKYLMGTLTDVERDKLMEWKHLSNINESVFNKLCNERNFSEKYKIYTKADVDKALHRFKRRYVYDRYLRLSLKYAAIFIVPLMIIGTLWLYKELKTKSMPEKVIAQASEHIVHGISKATLILSNNKKVVLNSLSQACIAISPSTTLRHDTLIYAQVKGNAVEADGAGSNKDNEIGTKERNEFWVTFEDGTKAHLNYNTSIRYPVHFDSGERKIYLKGEAYFVIAKDKRPFTVVTERGVIKDYGTEFNVNTFSPSNTKVVLVKGKVSVTPTGNFNHKELFLKTGQLACLKNNSTVNISNVDIEPYVSWNYGRYVFENCTLEDMMETMEHWYNMDVEFYPEDIKHLHFTGNVDRYGNIGPILDAVAKAANLRVVIKGRKVIIKLSN